MVWSRILLFILLPGIFFAENTTSEQQAVNIPIPNWFDHQQEFNIGSLGQLKTKMSWPYKNEAIPYIVHEQNFPILIKQNKNGASIRKTQIKTIDPTKANPFQVWQSIDQHPKDWSLQGPPQHKKLLIIVLICLAALVAKLKFNKKVFYITLLIIAAILLIAPPYKNEVFVINEEASWLISFHEPKKPYATFAQKDTVVYLKKLPKLSLSQQNTEEDIPKMIKALAGEQNISYHERFWGRDYIFYKKL